MSGKGRGVVQENKVFFAKKWRLCLEISAVLILFFSFLKILVGREDKFFSIELDKEDETKIVALGLDENEIENVEWDEEVDWTANFSKNNEIFQYRFRGKNSNLMFLPAEKKYYATSKIDGNKIKGKEICWKDNRGKIKKKEIKRLRQYISEDDNIFVRKNKLSFFSRLNGIFGNFFNLISFLIITLRLLGLRILKELLKSSSKNKESGFELKLFRDVNGLKEVKQELGEIVEYFRNPKIFHKVGAKVPKGIILSGPPGNGKTLLAKSLAGECNVPFIFKSGSEFEEMVVGLGSLRVRELFEEARSYEEGCIIFIDEIDSIGKKRYSKDSHTELTLNQLLNELDGFRQREKVIVIAATNNIEVLDKALLRPGRFDRKIYVPNPNLETRKEIINKNSRKLKFKSDVDLEELSSMTKGLSGAQIFNIFNEVKILMIREGKEEIDNEMVFEAFDRTLMGPSWVSNADSKEKKKLVAYHEAGHAVVGLSLPETLVRKITIIPRLNAGGYTWIEIRGKGDDEIIDRKQMIAKIMTSLGGRISEEIVFGKKSITAGSYEDIRDVTEKVNNFILEFGMSELGMVDFKYSSISELSEKAKERIEDIRRKLLRKCAKKARDLIIKNRVCLDLIAKELIEKKSIHRNEINYIFVNKISPNIKLLKSC